MALNRGGAELSLAYIDVANALGGRCALADAKVLNCVIERRAGAPDRACHEINAILFFDDEGQPTVLRDAGKFDWQDGSLLGPIALGSQFTGSPDQRTSA